MNALWNAVLLYITLGMRVVVLRPRSKAPVHEGWQVSTIKPEDVATVFPAGSNVGIILGEGLGDVDLDAPEAVAMADVFLPATPAEYGRRSKPRSHRVYRTDLEAPSRITFEDGSMVLELRGKNHQSMVPPSTHPSGEAVQWTEGEPKEPAAVPFGDLRRRCTLLAIAVVFARRWPAVGTRNDTALAVAGFLLESGCSIEETRTVMGAVARAADTDDWRERVATVDATARKMAAGEPCTGGPRLAELLTGDGGQAVKTIRKWLGDGEKPSAAPPDLLDRMNAKYFVARVGGKVIAGDESDPAELVLMPRHEFVALDPTRITVSEKKTVPVGQWWLDQTGRRQYGRIVFMPPPQRSRRTDYNLWKGFALEPRPGVWTVLRTHLLEVWCEGHEDRLHYVLDWFALVAQRPGTPAEIALVLRGGRGTGKSLPVREIGRQWFGKHFAHVSSAGHLTGRFNAALSAKCLVFADEAFWAGDRTAERELKRLITEPTLTIERKGIDPVEEANCIHLIIAGNEDHLVPAGVDERRFAVLDVSDARQGDMEHFRALAQEFAAGSAAAFLHEMQQRDFDIDRVKAGLQTEAFAEQKLLSLDSVSKFWHGCLMAGRTSETDTAWRRVVELGKLHHAYCEAAGRVGERRRSTETELGMKLRRLLPLGFRKFRATTERPLFDDAVPLTMADRRAYFLELPSLAACRDAFDRHTRHRWDWPPDSGHEEKEPRFG